MEEKIKAINDEIWEQREELVKNYDASVGVTDELKKEISDGINKIVEPFRSFIEEVTIDYHVTEMKVLRPKVKLIPKKSGGRKLATIRQIDSVEEIEGCDNIELAHIGGWQCIVEKGIFKGKND